MSSPLSMLGKNRRSPLQGILKEQRSKLTGSLGRSLMQDSAASDSELMSVMMKRLSQLEKIAESKAREIEHKDKRIADLQERLEALTDSEGAQGSSGRKDLEEKCHQLQKQVHEMEAFLGDYGLMWVGEKDDSAEKAPSFHMNFDLLLQRISDLNILVGKGESFIQLTATGAQLAKRDPIKLSLYSNGIVMFDSSFRSYEEPTTQSCMQDLMDGFFPSELQDRFPDGVPFQVEDRREEKFIPKLHLNRFPGEGQAVCDQMRESRTGGGCHLPDKTVIPDQSLTKLPVVKDGRLFDIGSTVREMGVYDNQSSSSGILIVTAALQAEKTESFGDDSRPLSSMPNSITLKVRSEDGNQTFILKMYISETVGQLRKYLDQHRGEGLPGYDLIRTQPKRYFNNIAATLHSCGLTTNVYLLLQKRKHRCLK